MPSGYVRDPDKEFFEICRRAYPYFIHTDSDFLNNLIPLMRAIDIAHNDMNKVDLYELVQKATDLLDGWDKEHKGVMTDLIRRHYFRVTSFDERFAELYDLAKGMRGKKADKELSKIKEKVEQLSIEVSKLKTLIAETPAQILPTNSSIANLSIALSTHIRTEEVPKEAPIEVPIIEAKPDVNEVTSMDTIKKEVTSMDAIKKEVTSMDAIKKGYTESDVLKVREYLKTNQEIENWNVREICTIDTSSASLLLRKLVKDKTIKNIGTAKRGAKYVVVSTAIEVPTAVEVPAPIPTAADTKIQSKALTQIETQQKLEQLRDYLKVNKEINNSKCREICNVNPYQAKRLLYKLVKDNFIEQIGVSSGTKYTLKE